jgi:hypothetical protein
MNAEGHNRTREVRHQDLTATAGDLHLALTRSGCIGMRPIRHAVRTGDRTVQPTVTSFGKSPHTERSLQVELADQEFSCVPPGACLPRLSVCLDRDQSGLLKPFLPSGGCAFSLRNGHVRA